MCELMKVMLDESKTGSIQLQLATTGGEGESEVRKSGGNQK